MEKFNGREVVYDENTHEYRDAETGEIVPTEKELVEAAKSSTELISGLPPELAALQMKEGEEWGAGADIEREKELFVNDFLIPKLRLVQAMSEMRIQGKASEGQYVNSLSEAIIADGTEEDPVELVVVSTFKRWHTFKINEKGKKEFLSSDVMTLQNANWEYEFKKDGIEHRRRQVLGFTVMLKSDLEKGLKRPYILDFYGYSKKAGRILITEVNELRDHNIPSAALVFRLTSKTEKNDDGTFYIKEIKKVGYTSPAVVKAAKEVYDLLTKHKDQIEVDERDIIKGEAEEVSNDKI